VKNLYRQFSRFGAAVLNLHVTGVGVHEQHVETAVEQFPRVLVHEGGFAHVIGAANTAGHDRYRAAGHGAVYKRHELRSQGNELQRKTVDEQDLGAGGGKKIEQFIAAQLQGSVEIAASVKGLNAPVIGQCGRRQFPDQYVGWGDNSIGYGGTQHESDPEGLAEAVGQAQAVTQGTERPGGLAVKE
jgi:hypothetical protein